MKKVEKHSINKSFTIDKALEYMNKEKINTLFVADSSKKILGVFTSGDFRNVALKGIKLNQPMGAFYVFPDISYFFGKTIKGKKIESASDFAIFLLEESHVATVTGDAFGSPNNIRISYAASQEQIKKAINRIKEAIEG